MNKRVEDRLKKGVRKFRRILAKAQSADVNEADTVQIIYDLLVMVFGWDRYSEVNRETHIKGGFCDISVKLRNKMIYLIEAKSVGTGLKDRHIRQAVNYARNKGEKWVILTNGVVWRLYELKHGKHPREDLILEFDLLEESRTSEETLEKLYVLSKEGIQKGALEEYALKKSVLNRYVVSSLMLSDDGLAFLRRKLKKVAPGVNPSLEEIEAVLRETVIKRDVLEDDAVKTAQRKVKRASRPKRTTRKKSTPPQSPLLDQGPEITVSPHVHRD